MNRNDYILYMLIKPNVLSRYITYINYSYSKHDLAIELHAYLHTCTHRRSHTINYSRVDLSRQIVCALFKGSCTLQWNLPQCGEVSLAKYYQSHARKTKNTNKKKYFVCTSLDDGVSKASQCSLSLRANSLAKCNFT